MAIKKSSAFRFQCEDKKLVTQHNMRTLNMMHQCHERIICHEDNTVMCGAIQRAFRFMYVDFVIWAIYFETGLTIINSYNDEWFEYDEDQSAISITYENIMHFIFQQFERIAKQIIEKSGATLTQDEKRELAIKSLKEADFPEWTYETTITPSRIWIHFADGHCEVDVPILAEEPFLKKAKESE